MKKFDEFIDDIEWDRRLAFIIWAAIVYLVYAFGLVCVKWYCCAVWAFSILSYLLQASPQGDVIGHFVGFLICPLALFLFFVISTAYIL